jgi:hypothetical protein
MFGNPVISSLAGQSDQMQDADSSILSEKEDEEVKLIFDLASASDADMISTSEEQEEDEDHPDEELVWDLGTPSDADPEKDPDLLPDIELEFDRASASDADPVLDFLDPIRYEIYPDPASELTEQELDADSRRVYQLLTDYLEEMEEAEELKILIPFEDAYEWETEDENPDPEKIRESVEEADHAWNLAFQSAFDAFYHTYGEYLWFDHLVILGDVDAAYLPDDEAPEYVHLSLGYEIGIPTDVELDEVQVLLMKLKDLHLNEDKITGFVRRLYECLLGRNPDSSGLAYWSQRLADQKTDGAGLAFQFVSSREFKEKGYDDTEYIQVLYRCLMDREADKSGLNYWKEYLENGMSRNYVFKRFVDSGEFTRICEDYGIQKGTITLTDYRDKSYKITSYVFRCYKMILERNGDASGLNYWTEKLINKSMGGGNVAASFINSGEFKKRGLSNEEIVTVAYKALLDRNPDSAGLKEWVSRMESGVSAMYVVRSMAGSTEFKNLCSTYGITPGTVKASENRDKNLKVTQFVNRCYLYALGRKGDAAGLNEWTGKLLTGKLEAQQVVYKFLTSSEFTKKDLSNTEFVSLLYRIYMDRSASAQEVSHGYGKLKYGTTREMLNNQIAGSDEFIQAAASYGLKVKPWLDNRSSMIYLDANEKKEFELDLKTLKDEDGNQALPSDIKNATITVGSISGESKKSLNGTPTVSGSKAVMKFRIPANGTTLEVPFTVHSNSYQNFTLTVQIKLDYVLEHTEEEIRAFYKSHPFNISGSTTFASKPSFSPYKAGRVSAASENDGLNALNFVRYIAGIGSDVAIDEEYVNLAQKASVTIAKINTLTHYPKQLSGMSDDFYSDAALGARSSNLAYCSAGMSLSYTIIEQYMDDGDSSNISRVGHRRWCLNPSMQYTGFGYCSNSGGYSALYAFDESRTSELTEGYVPWPGRVMPYEYFRGPWSIQFSDSSYITDSNIKVTLTTSSGRTMTFSQSKADGYFNYNSGGFGMGPAVIFEPNRSIGKNETVKVNVSGLKRPNGTETEINYTVKFFSMN